MRRAEGFLAEPHVVATLAVVRVGVPLTSKLDKGLLSRDLWPGRVPQNTTPEVTAQAAVLPLLAGEGV